MNKTNKLQVRDLINVGIFTAIYFVVMFAVGAATGIMPILLLFLPALIGIVCGSVYMLFMTKVNKKGMILIMSFIIGLLMVGTGHMWTTIAMAILVGTLAEVISNAGNYKNTKLIIIGYSIFNCWSVGAMLPIWIYRDYYFKYMEKSAGLAYTEAIKAVTPMWMLPVIIALAIIGGIIGGLIGVRLLKKHFIRAGIA